MLIGIDIAEVSRFENIGDAFFERVFTDDELSYITGKKSGEHAAANFAAKEAFSKAIGTGIRGFEFKDISVIRDSLGKPYFEFSHKIQDILAGMGVSDVELSISHDGGVAVAVVVVEQIPDAKIIGNIVKKTDTDDENIIKYKLVKSAVLPRKNDTHKGNYGRIFIVAGSKGMTGAAIMASKAALRSGGGLLTLGCPESLNTVFETSLHEVMTYPLPDNGTSLSGDCADDIIDKANKSSVLLIGCGLSCTSDIQRILKKVVREAEVPVVIDADGINALSKNINILKDSKAHIVLTPHIGEFARLSGYDTEYISANLNNVAKEFSTKWGVTLVLKSHKTVVADKYGNVRENILGNPGMATGGSGDVLAGIIASFVGQGISDATLCGVYVHSLAADIAAAKHGEYGMTPTDIIDNIPSAVRFICGR